MAATFGTAVVRDTTPCAHAVGWIRDHKNSYLLSLPRALITASSSQLLTLRCLEAQLGEAGALGDKSTQSRRCHSLISV